MGFCRIKFNVGNEYFTSDYLFKCNMDLYNSIIFATAITLTSKGEVLGNNKSAIFMSLILDISVTGILLSIAILDWLDIWMAGPFILFWLGMNVKAKLKAIIKNNPEFIKIAVKMGVLSLIPLNAHL